MANKQTGAASRFMGASLYPGGRVGAVSMLYERAWRELFWAQLASKKARKNDSPNIKSPCSRTFIPKGRSSAAK